MRAVDVPIPGAKQARADAPWENPAEIGESIDLVAALAVVLKRWPFILAAGAVGLVLASGYAFIRTPVFTSKAVFLPPTPQVPKMDNPLALLWKPQSAAIYPGLLASDSVVDDVIGQGDLLRIFKAKNIEVARNMLRDSTLITTDAAGFITLAVTNKDPKLAKVIASAYLAALGRVNDRLVVDEASQRRKIFQMELRKEESELESADVDLKKAQELSGVISPQYQLQAGLRSIDAVQTEIREQQVILAALLQGQTEQSPDVVNARSQIAALQGQLQRLQSGNRGAAGAGLTAGHAPEVNLEFVRLDRRVKFHQVLLEAMMRQFENAKQEETTAAAGVQVVDYPEVPLTKSAPKRTQIAVAGCVLGFIIGMVFVFVRNRWEFLHTDPARAQSMSALRSAARHGTFQP